MALLTLLSLVFAGILVAALATSLVLILLHLQRINRALADTRQALEVAREATQALGETLAPLKQLETTGLTAEAAEPRPSPPG